MSKRPPLLGYNHNVRHTGRLFHVQTEDSGLSRLYVTTHLFFEGTILATARTQYSLDDADEAVQKKMQAQHKTMLKRLRDGDFDHLEVDGRPVGARAGDSGTEHAAPREITSEPALATLRNQVATPPTPTPPTPPAPTLERPAAESRPAAAPRRPSAPPTPPAVAAEAAEARPAAPAAPTPITGPVLAPVAPPPAPPRSTPASGSLAERLRRPAATTSTTAPPPPPLPGIRPAQPERAAAPPQSPPAPRAEPAPVVEFEADLPDDEDDDLEPAVTIEVAEPPPDPTLSYGASSLAIGKLATGGAPSTARAPAPGPLQPIPPAPLPPSLSTRPLQASSLRARPTAEGVVLQRTLVPTPVSRPDSLRTTSPRARPTAPAPLAVAQPTGGPDDERSLDPAVLAYLARDIRK